MNLGKKTTINCGAPEKNDSFKYRRSSLQVNLSYVSSLTNCSVEDHDVDLLDKTDVTNDKTIISSKVFPNETLLKNVTMRKSHRKKINSVTAVLQNCDIDTTKTDKDCSNETNNINARNNDISRNVRNKKPNENNCQKKLHEMNMIMANINNDNGMQSESTMNTLYKKSRSQKNNINLLDIKNKDQSLNESCRNLKDAILSKTMQLFDKQNECSMRTSQVLIQKELMEAFVPIERLRSPQVRLILEKDDQVTMSDGSLDSPVQKTSMRSSPKCITKTKQKSFDELSETKTRLEDNESIISTPKKSITRQSMSIKSLTTSGLRKKRLFEEQNRSDEHQARNTSNVLRPIEQNKRKTIELDFNDTVTSDDNGSESPRKRLMKEDVALQKCVSNTNIINSPALDKEISESQSPVLTGTNRRVSSSKVSVTLRSKELNSCSKPVLRNGKTPLNSSSTPSLSNNRSKEILTAVPSLCSSYIEEHVERMNEEPQETNDEITLKTNITEDISEPGITVNRSVPMEITQVQGLRLFAKESVLSENSSLHESATHCTKTNNKMRSPKLIIHGDSSETNTHETSLNVNTSLDRTVDSGISCNKLFGTLKTIKQFSTSAMETSNIIESTKEKSLRIIRDPKTSKVSTNPLCKDAVSYLKSVLNEEEDINTTARTSLNVNTSIDGRFSLTQAENLYRIEESPELETEDKNEKSNAENISVDEEEMASDKRGSVSTVRTSLQMNTSLDNIQRYSLIRNQNNKRVQQLSTNEGEITESLDQSSPDKSVQVNSKKESEVECRYFNSLEDMSLIERLRNISRTKRISSTSNSRPSTRSDEAQMSNPETNNQNIRRNRESLKDGVHFIEGTPFPVSRSVLLKSQIKYNSIAKQLDTQKFPSADDSENLDTDGDSPSSVGSYRSLEDRLGIRRFKKSQGPHQKKHPTSWVRTRSSVLLDTIILDDTSSSEDSCDDERNRQTVVEHSTDANDKTENDKEEQPKDKSGNSKKKKLLPLRETSQLISLSPVVTEDFSPKEPRVKKKYYKKKIKDKAKIKTVPERELQKEIDDYTTSDENLQTVYTRTKISKKPRKVISKKIVVKKITNLDLIEQLEGNSQKALDHDNSSVRNRSSMNDFQPEKRILSNWRKRKTEKIVIVTTGLSNDDKALVKSVVCSLGSAQVEVNVTQYTTHVVSTGVRTINLLRGIIRGCWLVTLEWILKSLESNNWLDPAGFEMNHFANAVQKNRRERQLFGYGYIPELFAPCGYIYIESGTTPPPSVLKELVKTGGGWVTDIPENARVSIGRNGLKEIWILDSITTGSLQPLDQYKRK